MIRSRWGARAFGRRSDGAGAGHRSLGDLEGKRIWRRDFGANETIAGNFIGTDASGETSAANVEGILIETGTTDPTIGGTNPADRNVVAGNFNDVDTSIGIEPTGIDNLKIVGNFIDIDAAGEALLEPANETDSGIRLFTNGTGLQIGGQSAAERNVIDSGLDADNQTNALVQGNFFGTDRTGTSRVAGSEAAVYFERGAGVTIGGTAAGAANVFAMPFALPTGNDTPTTGLVVQGNFVGTDLTGTIPLGTGVGFGMSIGNSEDALIGGTNPSEGNTIAFVDGYGVLTQGQYVKILGNSIYSNTMDGLYIEDEDAGHAGPSSAPQLTGATATEIDGTYQGGLGDYRLEFFATPVEPAGSTYAASTDIQGKTFLGFENATEGPSGIINFTFTPNVPLTADEFITSTITPAVDNPIGYLSTVGFSAAIRPTVTATSSDVSVTMSASPNPVAPGGTLLFTINVTNNGSDAATGVSLSDLTPEGTTFTSLTRRAAGPRRRPRRGALGRFPRRVRPWARMRPQPSRWWFKSIPTRSIRQRSRIQPQSH